MTRFVVTYGINAMLSDEVKDEVAFKVLYSETPLFAEHFEVDICEMKQFSITIVYEPQILALTFEMAC